MAGVRIEHFFVVVLKDHPAPHTSAGGGLLLVPPALPPPIGSQAADHQSGTVDMLGVEASLQGGQCKRVADHFQQRQVKGAMYGLE